MKALFAVMLAATLGTGPALLRADPSPAAPAPSSPSAASVPATLALPAPATALSSSSLSAPTSLPSSPATDPQVGQPESTVYDLLGKPMGRILLPDKAVVLMYDRGDVTVRNGIVSAVKLLDPAVYAVKSAQQAALLAQSVKENARLTALRKSFLSDPGYLSLSTRDRLTALDRFDEDYPGSGIRDDYDALMAVYEAELAAQAQLADLEKRLTDAEQQAADAEQQVADAQAQAAAAQQQAAATQASASQQNNQTGGYIGTTVVTSNGNGVYYLGNPYFQPPRWGPRGGSPHVFASGNTTASPQAAN